MAPLLTLLAAAGVPTGPRRPEDLMPPNVIELPDGREMLAPYVEHTPLWENPMFLVVMALIVMCLLVALAFFIGSRLTQMQHRHYRNYHNINRRAKLESDFMKSDLFNAASEITKISALCNFKDRRRR
jgi:hypothetical protein